jgi:hypothetical protein
LTTDLFDTARVISCAILTNNFRFIFTRVPSLRQGTMTDPGLITPASSAGSSHHATLSNSPSQASGSISPPSYPSLSTSTSGSRPSTAPCSPDRVQTVTPASQQMVNPSSPIIASQLDGIVLGLQQLERQQVEQEQKRQALTEVQQLDSEADDDTAPSSTLNSNTNETMKAVRGEDRPSSIRHFIQNTRVS